MIIRRERCTSERGGVVVIEIFTPESEKKNHIINRLGFFLY